MQTKNKIVLGAAAAFILIGAPFAAASEKGNTASEAAVPVPSATVTTPAPEPAAEETTEAPVPTDEATPEETVEAEPELSVSQENAIESAESYVSYAGFSRKGLINQLKFEGYSKTVATFAVDYIDVDWNEQASRSAESYLDNSSFSRSGLINQLKFEGFTTAQAEYGVKANGL